MLVKVLYVDGATVITAAQLNAIQDAIIALESDNNPNIWQAKDYPVESALMDGIPFSSMVGFAEPSATTVKKGDLVICKGGGLLKITGTMTLYGGSAMCTNGSFDSSDAPIYIKSAYDYAVDGGFAGTEAEFAAKLAAL